MNLTLETADIASAKIADIDTTKKFPSIQAEIKAHRRSGKTSYKLVNWSDLPREFYAFFWKVGDRTMCAINRDNMDFQILMIDDTLPPFMYKFKVPRRFVRMGWHKNAVPISQSYEYQVNNFKEFNNTGKKITIIDDYKEKEETRTDTEILRDIKAKWKSDYNKKRNKQ